MSDEHHDPSPRVDQRSEGHAPKSRQFGATAIKMFSPVLILLAIGIGVILYLALT